MDRLQSLFQTRKKIEIPKGKIIVYEGYRVNKIYRIVSGYIKVYTVTNTGVQKILFIYKAGDVFPLATFLSSQKVARFFYEAMTPVTLQYITPIQLENKVRNNLPLGEEIIGYISDLDKQFLQRVNNMVSSKDPLSKLRSLLLFICERYNSNKNLLEIDLPLTPRVIGNMCGITTKQATQQLEFLKTKKIITIGRRIIVNRKKLEALQIP
jgi:CRP-like cAMP-binding protein